MITVQHKTRTHECFTVEEESQNWFISKGGCTFSKDEYKRMEWVNVTKEITIRDPVNCKGSYSPGGVYHKTSQIATLVCDETYRLRIDGDKAYIEKKL